MKDKQLLIPDGHAVQALLSWYDKNARTLPWRSTVSPYRTWLSEIMLQQTRVEAVKPYFERFLSVCPDIASLAGTDDETLLKLWEGLGYYSRVRNLKKAAILVMQNHEGQLPDDYEKLRALPGIGNYTAGAILSIAFGKRAAAVDGNVLRVLSRLTGFDGDVLLPDSKKWAEQTAFALCPEDRPGDFTQALIELGATVCVPNGEAKCVCCPLAEQCVANRNGKTDILPVKTAKKPRKTENRTVLVLYDRDKDCYYIDRRPEKGLLAGLYEFPNFEADFSDSDAVGKARQMGFEPLRIEPLVPAVHVFTHKEWHMKGYLLEGYAKPDCVLIGAGTQDLKSVYAIPSAFSAFLKQIGVVK